MPAEACVAPAPIVRASNIRTLAPAPRQLARHRAADDPSPYDDDVLRGHQGIIAFP